MEKDVKRFPLKIFIHSLDSKDFRFYQDQNLKFIRSYFHKENLTINTVDKLGI